MATFIPPDFFGADAVCTGGGRAAGAGRAGAAAACKTATKT